ncbi:MAG: hypothetical protein K0S33_3484 [Bacteroidetes bacterium]|jgi:hypothetical protein|nr:hypothetical protein [Bacteroidota bacterium]
MAFSGKEAEQFPLGTAAEWTARFRDGIVSGTTIAHFFGKSIITDILAQEGCMGIRAYYALDADNKRQLIIVGADANENDMYNGIIAEKSSPCPPFCGGGNPLNS